MGRKVKKETKALTSVRMPELHSTYNFHVSYLFITWDGLVHQDKACIGIIILVFRSLRLVTKVREQIEIHLNGKIFHWGGANDWNDRTQAGCKWLAVLLMGSQWDALSHSSSLLLGWSEVETRKTFLHPRWSKCPLNQIPANTRWILFLSLCSTTKWAKVFAYMDSNQVSSNQ